MIGGRYSLDREIGRGGTGVVWLGRDEVLGRPVAIKRVGLVPGSDSNADTLRAEREARIAASLNHPHVVGVYDLVIDDDHQWLVMEYVEGTTLGELVRDNGSLTADQAAPLLAQVASALAAAHASGVVHRDVKPSNILVRDDGHVKLTDFGIARAFSDSSLTQTGLVTGSPAYLAPEVASGKQATPASDVWSLGATLYHALAGHPPYEVTGNVLGALYRIVNETPPRLAQPGPMGPVLLATMTHDPRERWSMDEVARFLEHAEEPAHEPVRVPDVEPVGAATVVVPVAEPAPEPVPEPIHLAPTPGVRRSAPRRRPVLPLVIALVVVALVVAIVVLAMQDDPQDLGATTGTSSPAEPGSSDPGSSEPPAPPTEAALQDFVASYLQTASSDPAAGFELLTPEFQAQSPAYDEFWGSVTNPELLDFSADVDALTVSYTYQFEKRGEGRVTDDESLQLVRSGDGFLIDGQPS